MLQDEQLGQLPQRQKVLKEWINRQLPDEDGYTALHEAAGMENYQILQFLLAHGGDINVVDYKGQTMLHEATKWSQPINSTILFHLGIPIDVTDNNQMTPLHQCSARSQPDALMGMEFCAAHGANINKQDGSGQTPLHYACFHAQFNYTTRMIRLLLQKGADPNIFDN